MQPYQKLLQRTLSEYKRILIKKSRGIGCSTWLLLWLGYCCLTDKFPKGSRICIVTGPSIRTAQDLLDRFRNQFAKVAPNLFDRSRSTQATLNSIKLEIFPSHNSASMRGLDKVVFLLLDECDYWPKFQQQEIRAVAEGLISKPNSNPTIIFMSTPNAPGGLMQQLELEKDSLYYRLFLDYRYGLEGEHPIYTQSFIDEMRRSSPEFLREMELQYIGKVGNVFSPQSIEKCQSIPYNPDEIIPYARVSMGIDPSFGSSSFGICAVRFVDSRIQVVIAEEHSRPDFNSMIDRIYEIKKKMGIDVCYVDAANPVIWQPLKKNIFHENHTESYVFSKLVECEKNNTDPHTFMNVVPVAFSKHHKSMLQNTKSLVEDPDNLVLIDKRFDKLLTALTTATAKEYSLSKEETSYNDVLDAFRLSLQAFKRNK
jgi:hypothetical protein